MTDDQGRAVHLIEISVFNVYIRFLQLYNFRRY